MTTAEAHKWDLAHSAQLRATAPAAQRPFVILRHPAWLCLTAAIGLTALGLFAINSTGGVHADGLSLYAVKHAVFIFIGLLAAGVAAAPHYKRIGRFAPALSALIFAMLVFVLIPVAPEWLVTPRNGARRWISLGVVDFQPSELAKIVYVIALARYLRFRRNYRRLRGLLAPLLMTFVPVGLIVLEPDLGTAMLFFPAMFAMLIAAGAKLKHLALAIVVAIALAPSMYPLLEPHQQERLIGMWHQLQGDQRYEDSLNYQAYQAITLVGAGGATGLGAEHSRAVIDYNDLPEDHNDMIFAVVVNRFGLVGGLATLAMYALWLVGAMWTAWACRDPFGRLVAVGLAAMLIGQAVVNMAMTLGLAPITGMTLPFVSYGGSSLVAAFLMTGLIFNIAMRRPAYLQRKSFEFGPDEV